MVSVHNILLPVKVIKYERGRCLMFAVLSEINCLDKLNKLGVYPDEFYTDLDTFRNRAITFKDATLMVIFAGSFRFNKRHTIEMIKNFVKRASSEKDSGIKKVYVLSDVVIPSLNKYYKYLSSIDRVDIMRSWSVARSDVDIWKFLQTEKHESKCFMSSYDLGNATPFVEAYTSPERHNTEDEYTKLIFIPNIKEMLSLS